jgi:putative transposase
MPKLQAVEINLNEHEKTILTQMKNGSHTELHLKKRSEIILRASDGESTRSISREIEIDRESVRKWRNRYASASEEISRTDAESPKKVRRLIEKILSDAPRPGAPSRFTDEQVACIIALACELPENLGLPFSHWSPSLLRKEAIKRGIVESISAVHVGRFLKSAGFKAASSQELAESKDR